MDVTCRTNQRKPLPAAGDPTGRCTACHSAGQLAAKAAPHFNHPDNLTRSKLPANLTLAVLTDSTHPDRAGLACDTCHDPHLAGGQKFLRKTPDQLCASCHEQAVTLAGAHDFTTHADAKNALARPPLNPANADSATMSTREAARCCGPRPLSHPPHRRSCARSAIALRGWRPSIR